MRLLVAEDDRGLREVLARGFRESGYAVDAVPDGQQAISFLRVYEYEVAVLDWRMPAMSAWKCCSRCAVRGCLLRCSCSPRATRLPTA